MSTHPRILALRSLSLVTALVAALGAGWKLERTADGSTISGRGTNPDGNSQRWIAFLGTPVPEPSTLLLAALTLVPFSWRRRGVRNHNRPRAVSLRFAPLAIALLASLAAAPARSVTLEWTRQLGTSSYDNFVGVSADGLGSVYVSGPTAGSLGGPSAGSYDAFVSKYDAAGALQWTRQLGTSAFDESNCVSADGLGNVYISGNTLGNLVGTNAGDFDALVTKYDAAGNLQWTRQFGTSNLDLSRGVSADGLGNVYISGNTGGSLGGPNAGGGSDAFVSKYDAAGSLQWTGQLGTSAGDSSYGVSADGLGNVYISGYTAGSLDGPNAGSDDAFVAKYDSAGTLQWTRQLGTSSDDKSYRVSADSLGNVFISGHTSGSLGGPNAGGSDAFLAKYDAAGNLQWTRQLGTSSDDTFEGVSADGLGSVYVSGYTKGGLQGPNAGGYDALVSKYDAAGTLQWTRQLGTSTDDFSGVSSADGLGNLYISGRTDGNLAGPNAGGSDGFLAKFSDSAVPEPSTLVLTALALAPLVLRRSAFDRRTPR